jgi:hypothetical protein
MKRLLQVSLVLSLAINGFLAYSILNRPEPIHESNATIHPRPNHDVSVTMKNMFNGEYDAVILVHGWSDNLKPAKEIMEYAEKTAGRPPGTFSIQVH